MTRYWTCEPHGLWFSDQDKAFSHRQHKINNGDNTCRIGVKIGNPGRTIQGIQLREFETIDSSFTESGFTQELDYSNPENDQEAILDHSEIIDSISPEP